jgi:hypothetical protein
MMVKFVSTWLGNCPDIWSNINLDVLGGVLDEIRFAFMDLSKADLSL